MIKRVFLRFASLCSQRTADIPAGLMLTSRRDGIEPVHRYSHEQDEMLQPSYLHVETWLRET